MKLDANQTTGSAASAVGQSVLNQGVHRSDGDRRSKIDSLSQDRLELSGLVSDIANARAAGAARRGEHVKALAKLCRTGAYVPDPSALSRKLIDDALASSETGNESF